MHLVAVRRATASATVAMMSTCVNSALRSLPAGIRPGQPAINGMRWPPFHASVFWPSSTPLERWPARDGFAGANGAVVAGDDHQKLAWQRPSSRNHGNAQRAGGPSRRQKLAAESSRSRRHAAPRWARCWASCRRGLGGFEIRFHLDDSGQSQRGCGPRSAQGSTSTCMSAPSQTSRFPDGAPDGSPTCSRASRGRRPADLNFTEQAEHGASGEKFGERTCARVSPCDCG